MYQWPLNINQFTWLDRLKICKFFLNPKNRWTQDKYVREYEKVVAKYVGVNHAIFVSSGSAANQLMAQYVKDDLINKGEWPKRNKVIVSAVTWQTNVSVWVREGFEPIFVDINLEDFCLDYKLLEVFIRKFKDEIACVFPTSVLGFTPNIDKLQEISIIYHVRIMMDNCENFFGTYGKENISYPFTSSTSCFFAHQITTGQEGGFVFTNNKDEAIYFILSRAHGLTRNLTPYNHHILSNQLVNSEFDFHTLSSNYRNSDIAAFMGLLDFARVDEYKEKRIATYEAFYRALDRRDFLLPPEGTKFNDVPFCFPIISKKDKISKVKGYLTSKSIEYRPFISGNMLRQKPYQKYGNYQDFPNAEFINNNALYVGFNNKLKPKDLKNLAIDLNNI
jgi:CDP-6-deoxy-D-xylo-4-hexulose-3-dehydrase